jgi:hypothetical protein
LKAGLIKHRLDTGKALFYPPDGVVRDPADGRLTIAGDLWDLVDFCRGVLDHPVGVARPIEIWESDAMAHFSTWSVQEKSPAAKDNSSAIPPPADQSEQAEALGPAEAAVKELSGRLAKERVRARTEDIISWALKPGLGIKPDGAKPFITKMPATVRFQPGGGRYRPGEAERAEKVCQECVEELKKGTLDV